MIRLDKFLADMNTGSRKEVKNLIRHGDVKVEGEIIKDPGQRIAEDSNVVVCGTPVIYQRFYYYMLNKPAGYITATDDPSQPFVMSLLRDVPGKDLFPVGRLDKDTVGLLLITNDGALAHRLLSPNHHVPKVYEAKLDGILMPEHIVMFAEGLKIDDEWTARPAKLEILSTGDISTARITITEGKYHQVKRMFAKTGCRVTYLKRLSFGSLVLDPTLKEGEYRALKDHEVKALCDFQNP